MWTKDKMKDFLVELAEKAKPLIDRPGAFGTLGDHTGYVTQDRETADTIRHTLAQAEPNGLDRLALITSSSLVRLQFKRINSGLELEFFDSKSDALSWLRRPR